MAYAFKRIILANIPLPIGTPEQDYKPFYKRYGANIFLYNEITFVATRTRYRLQHVRACVCVSAIHQSRFHRFRSLEFICILALPNQPKEIHVG